MQIATWNINSLNVRLPQVLDWLADNPVDVLALQELKLTDDKFPAEALARTPPPRRMGASGGAVNLIFHWRNV